MLLEEHESDIEEWYFKSQGDVPLKSYLCSQLVLQNGDDSCLLESDNDKLTNSRTMSESQQSQNNLKAKEEL